MDIIVDVLVLVVVFVAAPVNGNAHVIVADTEDDPGFTRSWSVSAESAYAARR